MKNGGSRFRWRPARSREAFQFEMKAGGRFPGPLRRQSGDEAISLLGAFRDVTLGYFDWQRRDYERIPLDEQVEVLAPVGDVSLHERAPTVC